MQANLIPTPHLIERVHATIFLSVWERTVPSFVKKRIVAVSYGSPKMHFLVIASPAISFPDHVVALRSISVKQIYQIISVHHTRPDDELLLLSLTLKTFPVAMFFFSSLYFNGGKKSSVKGKVPSSTLSFERNPNSFYQIEVRTA